ncbi:MAG: DUF1080 domain-containing protein [Fimbriimonadales bacterium]
MPTRPTRWIALLAAGSMTACLGLAYVAQEKRDGYRDTPILPGQKWHVHDPDRPYPHEVVPGVTPGAPPSDAIVLFDGTDLSHWMQTDTRRLNGKSVEPKWKLRDGCIEVAPGTGDLFSREKFGDCQLHIEWQEPLGVQGASQGRGNSGVFLMGRYEIQVLDSYRHSTYADGQAGALYGQWPPLVNPMRKPGEWQTYDVVFQAPRFDGDRLVEPAYVTLFFNGVLVHNHQKLNGPTGHRSVPPYTRQDSEDRLGLQDHGSSPPLRYRNIWVRKLAGYDQPEK